MPIHTSEYEKLDDALLAEWQQLWERADGAHSFNSPSWFLACQEYYPSGSCKAIFIRDKDGLAAVLSLREEFRYGVAVQCFPGGKHLGKAALLVKNQAGRNLFTVLASLLFSLKNFYLSELDEALALEIKKKNPGLIFRQSSINRYFSLRGDPLAKLPRKRQKKIFKQMEKFKDKLSFKCFEGSEGLNVAFEIDQRSSKREKGMATFVNAADREFYGKIAKNFGKNFLVCTLLFGGFPIAFEMGFIHKKIFYSCNTAYDKSFGNLSPRKILLYHSAPRLKKDGFEIFDFARGDTALKREFAELSYRQFDLFYAQNFFVRFWWRLTASLREKLVGNKYFYRPYLELKKKLVNFKLQITNIK